MKIFLTLILLNTTITLSAQMAGDIYLEDIRDNKNIKLSALADGKGLVMIFTGTSCPYNHYYAGRINKLGDKFESRGINVVLVNSNEDEVTNMAALKKFAADKGYDLPYLIDKDKSLMNTFGVTKNPEVVLLKKDEDKMVVFYQGAIDNNPQIAEDVKERYLEENIENLLNNKPASPAEIRPTGCRIK